MIPIPPPPGVDPNSIPFTQYLQPSGRTRTQWWAPTSEEQERKAKALMDADAVFTSELLLTGEASFTVEKDDEVLAHEIAPNGPPVIEAVERLIETAYGRI